MATKKDSSTPRKSEVARNKEERTLLMAYRYLSRWDKSALSLLVQSLAWGKLAPEETDGISWESMRRHLGLPAVKKGVKHA